MRFLDATDTRAALPMLNAIAAMEHAFSGESETPLRSLVGVSLVMPGRLDDIMAVKVVSTVPGNPAGLVAVFGPDGSPLGIVDGPTLTAIRTGAACGLATRLLSDPEARTLAMLGAGAMAFDQVEAIRAVRPIERVLVWSRSESSAAKFASMIGGEVVASADDAVAAAEVISCATPSRSPLFSAGAVRPGTHVNAVGAFTPDMVEVPGGLVDRAFVVVDDFGAAAAEAGDLLKANRTPDATMRQILVSGHNRDPDGVTFFKSVGVAAQDVAAGHAALVNAVGMGVGVDLG